MTLIRELIDIPTRVREGDFVLKLTEGVTDAAAEATVASYEVTPQLAEAFDAALGTIAGAVGSSSSEAVYLHGSFGSGKSHFMAVLHLLLQGHPAARAKAELHGPIARHDPALSGRRFLLVPVHFLDARSMEQKILGGYVERVAALHPGAPLPPVFLGDLVVAKELPGLREKLGEKAFLDGLNATGAADEGWGEFASTWTTESLEAALAAPATSEARRSLVAAYVAAYRQGTATEALATGEGYVDLSRGLAAVSAHAQALGYDAVVLFLDELILWLASTIGDLDFVQREAQKLTNLVEGSAARRPVPVVSFVSRQRDLRELVGDHIAGAERVAFADTLALQSGRFGEIVLEARNLPVVAKRRVLRAVSDDAERRLRVAVDEAVGGRDDVRSVLLGSEADLELFRTVYPFSPTLVRVLVDVSEALQRERTALKVMLQLLVDRRDRLALGEVIPVGDLWDVVAARDEPFARELRGRFATAKRLYRSRLRPMLLAEHGLSDDGGATGATGTEADPRGKAFEGDDRLVKTLLLAALVPEVDDFRNLDAARLAALNWGSVRTPVPRRETQVVVDKLREWRTTVGEINVGDDPVRPTVSITLVEVDGEAVIAAAREIYDRVGDRRRILRELVDELAGGRLGDVSLVYKLVWRGTEREVDVVFANVRDRTEVTDSSLRAAGSRPRVVVDFPFDASGYNPEHDLERLDNWDGTNQPTPTVCWLPSFLNDAGLGGLGRYVALREVLRSEQRFEQHTEHLSERQRAELRPVLVSTRDALRGQLVDAVLVAYGVRSGTHPWVDEASALPDHFRSLDPSLVVRPTTSPTMAGALDELCDQVFSHHLPGHPRFETKVTPAMLRTTWEEVQRAVADPDGRVVVEATRRGALRAVAGPLGLGQMHDAPFVLSSEWLNRLDRHLHGAGSDGRAVTVADVRAWIDEIDGGPRGLPPEIADLIVLTVAAQCDHRLWHRGAPLEPTVGRPLPHDALLRPEQLPDAGTWRQAADLAVKVFGVAPPGVTVSGPAVEALAAAVGAKATGWRDGADRLVRELDDAYRRAGVDDGNRRRTARAARDLLRSLQGAAPAEVVDRLAGFAPPTSPEAAARSLSSAELVARSLADANWIILGDAPAAVAEQLRRVLAADELAEPWDDARRDLVEEASRALRDAARTEAPAAAAAAVAVGADPGLGGSRRIVRDRAELEAVVAEVEAALDGHGSVEVAWRAPARAGD